MSKTFVTADLHLGHIGVTQFLRPDGTKLRPWDDVDSMNAALIKNWNSVVGAKDLVYVLGDLTVNKKHIWLAQELNGRKILVKGNHDNGTLAEYAEYFEDVVACVVRSKAILTHIPVHSDQLERFGHNIHGHTHAAKVMKQVAYHEWASGLEEEVLMYEEQIDDRYTCCSVEQTNFHPIDLYSILEKL